MSLPVAIEDERGPSKLLSLRLRIDNAARLPRRMPNPALLANLLRYPAPYPYAEPSALLVRENVRGFPTAGVEVRGTGGS